MSVHERNNDRNRVNTKQGLIIVVATFVFAFFLIFCPSLARFVTDKNERVDTAIAQWKIQVNGVSLSGDSVEKVQIELKPDSPSDASGKIRAGQTGYFDVAIDPEGTQVALSYTVNVDTAASNLPNGMSVYAYSVNGGESIPLTSNDKSVSGNISLPESGVFGSGAGVTVRYYWSWADENFEEFVDGKFVEYNIVVTATVSQNDGETAEGAQTL